MRKLMTLTPPTLTWNNPFLLYSSVVAETEHYAVIQNPNADKFTADAEYLLIFKERNTIESREGAYVHIMVHMYDAEAMYTALAGRNEYPKKIQPESNEKLN